MLSVIVVDDNDLIRKSIMKRVDWEGLGLVCVGEAADGHRAYELIEELKPSIVITDVKMPIADGFYTIGRCHNNFPEVQFIIISGYDDFVYVKQAIQLNVVNYILKPIDSDELTETLQKARDQVYQYRRDRQERQQTQVYRRHYQEQRVANLFHRFFTYKIDYMDLQEQLEQAGYPLRNPCCACVCINFCAPDGDGAHALAAAEIAQLEQTLEALYLFSTCKLLHVYKNIYAVVCTYRESAPLSAIVHEKMYQAIAQGFLLGEQTKLWLSWSDTLDCAQLTQAYQQCLQRMFYRFTQTEQTVFVCSPQSGADIAGALPPLLDRLEIALDLHLKGEGKDAIRQIIAQTAQSARLILEYLPRVFLMLDGKVDNRLSIREFDPSLQKYHLLRFYDLRQMEETLCRLVDSIVYPAETVDIGAKVIAYIDRSFTQQLTLRELGDLFHVNHIYLGQLVKKKTGMLFNAYLSRLRLERAKELIEADPSIVLKDLSYSLGFADSHYFTKVFKQNVGLTPTEYRDQMLQNHSRKGCE